VPTLLLQTPREEERGLARNLTCRKRPQGPHG
jgi:hypothetical protein